MTELLVSRSDATVIGPHVMPIRRGDLAHPDHWVVRRTSCFQPITLRPELDGDGELVRCRRAFSLRHERATIRVAEGELARRGSELVEDERLRSAWARAVVRFDVPADDAAAEPPEAA